MNTRSCTEIISAFVAVHSLYIYILIVFALASCSTTKNLPEGEVLYTGIGNVQIEGDVSTKTAAVATAAIDEALAYPPNNSLFGSSSIRIPFPVGLWIYNRYVNSKTDFGRFMFKRFASKPTYISYVNPGVRTAIATASMRENGYFDGTAAYAIVPDAKNPRKAKIDYSIALNHLYTYDSIRYISTRSKADSIIMAHPEARALKSGGAFSVSSLEEERQNISALLRKEGFYYHHPEYIVYQADTLMEPGKVQLRVMRKPGLPSVAMTPFVIGDISLFLNGYKNESPTDSTEFMGVKFFYENKLHVRPSAIYKRIFLKSGELYSEEKEKKTQLALAKLEIFRFAEMQFSPRDTARRNNVLDLSINTLYDLPYNGEFQLNVTDKSNSLLGPGLALSLTRYNLLGGGEILKLEANGSHEWDTGKERLGLNSYEVGLGATLTLPFVLLPSFTDRGLDYPSFSTFKVSGNLLNRARFFRMMSFNAGLSYEFLPNVFHHHVFTPLRITYTKLQSRTHEFDSISMVNPSLRLSLADQFIPALSYTYTYDDASQSKAHHVWWETSITEAGNLLSTISAIAGNNRVEGVRRILGNTFAQFVKATGEYRYNHRLDKNNRLVARFMAGAIISYGNSTVAPFSEQFYLGGANSIRAFSIRSVGPGRFIPENAKNNRYAYIDQTGDIKIEANIEYRFRIAGSLFGATFLDSGGLWLLRDDRNRQGGEFNINRFFNDITLGAGAGIRYDLDFLVIRLDAGVGLHLPYDTGKSGYYNIPRFKDALGVHLAVGYPF
ncbi:MAG: BamA/TamA family outer membrane protein [Tannerellaceae bacterium]|nr:BamA/TamA family outer membrane protein [Tannerellaceae bacterium]